jgi:hypothetical protein
MIYLEEKDRPVRYLRPQSSLHFYVYSLLTSEMSGSITVEVTALKRVYLPGAIGTGFSRDGSPRHVEQILETNDDFRIEN